MAHGLRLPHVAAMPQKTDWIPGTFQRLRQVIRSGNASWSETGRGAMTVKSKNQNRPTRIELEDHQVFEFDGFTDSRLVELSRDGNQDAFGELVRRYEGRLMRVISRFIVDQDQVDDLTQETFLRVFRRLELFDSSRRFGPWLFQIGVNLTLDFLRKTQRRIRWTLFSQRSTDEPRPIDPEMADPRNELDLSQEVRTVLDQLPEKYRAVLVLRDLENFTTAEIAAILNRKEATIRWRLAEARSKFEKLWTARQNRDAVSNGAEVKEHELQDGSAIDSTLGG